MKIVCLDLEGVLLPEFWEEFSKAVGIKELMLTTVCSHQTFVVG
jgi:phosphoserine phosphatase